MPSIFPPRSSLGNYKLVKQDINQPGQTELSGHKSPDNSNNPKKVPKQVGELEKTLLRFGPVWGKDTEAITLAKKEAWQHIVDKARNEEKDSIGDVYLSAILEIERETRDFYEAKALEGLNETQFREMMVTDGCFFLQWTLSILGGFDLLAYPENSDVYFGKDKGKDNTNCRWMEAMFFVGNQIPCVVLRQLMKQSFFQDVMRRGRENRTWVNPPSDDLTKMVLYELVVLPQVTSKKVVQNPSDLLHALYCRVLGPGTPDNEDSEPEEDYDDLDLEAGFQINEDPADSMGRLPSATDLTKSGIKLRMAKGGMRQHRFESYLLFAYLYVAPLTFDSNTELMLQYLKQYEIAQIRNKNEHQVAAYLCCMRDLLQTRVDVQLLESKGIIQLKNKTHKDKLPRMLTRLCSEEIPLSHNLRYAERMAKGFVGQQFLVVVSLYLGVLQTWIAFYSFIAPSK